jgi:hypothetical protein
MSHYNKASIIGLGILAILTGLCIYWLYIQEDIILEVENPTALLVDKESYHPGEPIVYEFEYRKSRKSVAVVTRAIVNSYRITFDDINSDLPCGYNKIKVADLTIPDVLKPDGHKYHIDITAVYRVNPLRKQYVYLRTQDFLVE